MAELAKQAEILFLWDGENWNPNGDILNDMRPGMTKWPGERW